MTTYYDHSTFHPDFLTKGKDITIALAGQPNMGKSTLFNLFTGLNQHVGNWTGKTVEKREGTFQSHHRNIHLIDLPGTYSLTANSPEEVIAREYILQEKPDLVIAVVSAANLERSLYLVSELIALPIPLIVALNMVDVAKMEGIEVNAAVLEAALGVPVVPVVATHAHSARNLLNVLEENIQNNFSNLNPNIPEIRADHREVLQEIKSLIQDSLPAEYPAYWAATKMLEGDSEIEKLVKNCLTPEQWQTVASILKEHDDSYLAIASGRYDWIGRMIRAAVHRPRAGQISVTDQLDRWATHPIIGLVFLAAVLGLVFWLTFAIGAPLQDWLDSAVIAPLGEWAGMQLVDAPVWLNGLIVDGIIGGVGAVLTFLPIIIIFFAIFGLLEDVGYMARAAYVMDNFMHWMGLHGKSFLPLFLGFGCNVPAVMGARVIESYPARILTILLAPLIPCTARMAVVAFLAPAFFGKQAGLVTWGLILFSLAILVISGVILNRILFKGERTAFIMELPLYHIPNLRSTALLVWQRSLSFIRKAGTLILMMSLVVWALSVLPGGDLESSYLARIGNLFAPIGKWMGLDWRLTVALLTSFFAKENSIATLGVLFSSSEESGLTQTLAATYSTATGLSFLVVSLLFIPCAATVAVIHQETGSWKWTLVNILLMLVLSIGTASGVYALANLIGL
jgi:ferrous iron transport protein B